MESAQSVTCAIMLAAGSRYETSDTNGIAHFAEHMFFKGTKRRPTARDISKEIDAIGGEFNAFTGKEYTGYYVKCAAESRDVALDVLVDMLRHSKFDLLGIELGVAQHVDEDVERDIARLGGALDVVPGVLLAGEGVELAADGVDLLGDVACRRPALRSLEEHVLGEVRDAVGVGRLVARAGREHDRARHRLSRFHRRRQDAETVRERVELEGAHATMLAMPIDSAVDEANGLPLVVDRGALVVDEARIEADLLHCPEVQVGLDRRGLLRPCNPEAVCGSQRLLEGAEAAFQLHLTRREENVVLRDGAPTELLRERRRVGRLRQPVSQRRDRGKQAVDLLGGVVVDDAGAHGACVLEAEPLHRLDGVVVALPDRVARVAESRCRVASRYALDVEGEGGDTAVHRR